MGFFGNGKADVNASEIENFISAMENLENELESVKGEYLKQIEELEKAGDEVAKESQKAVGECENIHNAVKNKVAMRTRELKAINERLASTPKTIKKTNENGETTESPNPEYAKLESQKSSLETKVSKLKGISEKLNDKEGYMKTQASYATSASEPLYSSKKHAQNGISDILEKTRKAKVKAKNAKDAVSTYVNFSIR